ncbi:hypothetical protein [Fodinicola feengrottensis]|uniref:hypothetical protein n=1 Tax=Fodinicola feengrottensis TaxID=435914 RepID=UPI0013CF8365|nr:hypothetical protein [Fodinicola feengrottensis]
MFRTITSRLALAGAIAVGTLAIAAAPASAATGAVIFINNSGGFSDVNPTVGCHQVTGSGADSVVRVLNKTGSEIDLFSDSACSPAAAGPVLAKTGDQARIHAT